MQERQPAENNAIISIPNWNAEDYETSKPFDWLYQFRSNKFVMTQKREKMRKQAGAVGVRNFVTLWNAYLATRRDLDQDAECNLTEFEGQPVQLMSGAYKCDDYGITTFDNMGFEVTVCPHPILPVRRLVNIDTDEMKLEVAFQRGNRWRSRIFDKTTLASSQKIIELSRHDIAVNSESARSLVGYMSEVESLNYDQLETVNSVGRLGWMKGHGFSPYVDNLLFDGDSSFQKAFAAVSEHGEYDSWMQCVKAIRSKGLIARIMLAASFASVLIEPCSALPFFVHIWGGTESGKTLGLMLAASVWANPAMGEYIHTFNSTAVGQEMMAGFCNNLPLCIDELQVIKDRRSFDSTIYMLAEGIGKSRGAKAGGMQRTQSWRNCIITTGEMPISNSNSGGGAINRIIEIDCGEERLFDSPREVAATLHENYGFAGRRFVEELQQPGRIEYAKGLFAEFSRQLGQGNSTEKQTMAAALLLTADRLAEEIIFSDSQTLSVGDIEQFLTSKQDVDQNARALEWLFDFVSSNPIRFSETNKNQGECWGKIDDDYIYFIKSTFDAKMQEGGFSPASFLSWAKRRGHIECDKEGKNTKSKWINGGRSRCVWIKLPAFMRNVEELPENALPF